MLIIILVCTIIIVTALLSKKKKSTHSTNNSVQSEHKTEKHRQRYYLEYRFIPELLQMVECGQIQPGYLYNVNPWRPWIERENVGFDFDWESLSVEIIKLDDSKDIIFYKFPIPEQTPEAVWGAIVLNVKSYKGCYYTLEASYNENWVLGSTSIDNTGNKTHFNYGYLENPSVKTFLNWVVNQSNENQELSDHSEKMLRIRAKQEAERMEQERINEEMKDPRWKVCPNGHCYENIRKECPWCGKDKVVGRLDKDVSLQHKELYVGKQNGHYILTSDASIPMQEERIRKITIDYYQDKFVYFHIDGKNPNPFYFNTIRLNQGCIKGRMLTKYIELIMKGKCDYLDLSSCIERNN